MSRDIILPGGDTLKLFDSTYTASEVEAILTKALRQSERNLLINSRWDVPANIVNQRGAKTYGQRPQVTIDCWKIGPNWAYVDLHDEYITLRGNDVNGYGDLYQSLEPGCVQNGQIYTFSALLKGYTGIRLGGEAVTAGAMEDFVLVSRTFTMVSTFVPTIGANSAVSPGTPIADIKAAKLELGNRQTLAHQDANGNWVLNDPPPNFALELAKCQRYQVEMVADKEYGAVGNVFAINGSQALVNVPLCTPLRSNPTASYAGEWRLVSGSTFSTFTELENGIVVTNIQFVRMSTNCVTLLVYTDTNIDIGQAYGLCYASATQKNSLLFDSNL